MTSMVNMVMDDSTIIKNCMVVVVGMWMTGMSLGMVG